MRRAAVVLVLGLLAAGCHAGSGPPEPGAPVNPRAVGESVDVGGWSPVDTLLADSAAKVENPGEEQPGGWVLKVVSPSGPCPGDPMAPEKEVVCVGLEVTNNATVAGGLDIQSDLPVLADSTGAAAGVTKLRIADTTDWVDFGQAVSIATDCTFSAPDGQGRQAADCAAMVFCERRSGVGGEETSGWVTVGAGRTARYDLEYIVGVAGSGLALWWPDGTWFTIP
jgi:hypothetical protein